MKKATKKQAKKPAKKVSANEKMVAVRSASDLEALYDSGCSGIHMVTGYTIHIEADIINLEGAVCFKDCTLVNSSNMTINGTIVTTGALHMESCTLNGSIDVQTGQGLYVVDRKGFAIRATCVGAIRATCVGASIIRENSLKYVTLIGYSSALVEKGTANSLLLRDIKYYMEINDMVVDGEPVTVSHCMAASLRIHHTTARCNVRIERSIISVDMVMSKVDLLTVSRSVLEYLCADEFTVIGQLDATLSVLKDSICFLPDKKPMVSTYMTTGFPRYDATIYKKVLVCPFISSKVGEFVLELSVPAKAEARFNSYSKKYRVSEAVPVAAYAIVRNPNTDKVEGIRPAKIPLLSKAYAYHDPKFRYKIGKTAVPRKEPFDMSDADCSSGIHGFLDPMDAANY